MSTAVPTVKQSLADIVLQRFPWLAGVVAVAGAKGKGLAIRTASGLLHLAGGPDDPAVHRVGDLGTAGTVEVSAGGTALKFTNANGDTWEVPIVYAAGAVTVGPSVPPGAFKLVTMAETGSDKVTSA